MKKDVLISVCIAVYNMEKYVEQCLDSVLRQDFDDYEIVLIDNGSDDSSIEICERYAKQYPEIISFYKLPKPTELGRAYYECFRKMNGFYHLSIDSDDYLCPGALKNIAAAIQKSQADLIMGTFICEVEEGETNFKDTKIDAEKINLVPYEQAIRYIASLDNFHTVQWRYIQKIKKSNTLVSHYNDKKGFDIHGLFGRFGDTYNVMEIFKNAKSIYYLDEPFYVYRRRKGSITGEHISENIIIDYLKFAIASLAVIDIQTQNKEFAIREYVIKQQSVKFSLFKHCIHLLSPEKKEQVCGIIQNNIEMFHLCPEYGNDDMNQMYRCMKKDGLRKGLDRYMESVDHDVVQKALEKKNSDIVIFPTGTISAGLEKLFYKNGIDIHAYIDNDEKKDEKEYFGKTCFLPYKYVKSKKDSMDKFYIISTAYSNLRGKLKDQLLSYGVNEDEIFVWE